MTTSSSDGDPPESDPPESDPPESAPPESDPPESDPPESDPPESDPPESEPSDSGMVGELKAQLLNGLQIQRLRNMVAHRAFGKDKEAIYVGKYVTFEPVGAGGMGTVYSGYDPKLDRKVAVKIIRGQKKWTKRVEREAQALAKVDHPNVVRVYDSGEHDGDVFLAMEFVDGPTLGEWVEDKDRSWREILEMYKQAGRGLAAAHAEAIIHRDFKPQNVLVGNDGRVRVLDFGLARGQDEDWSEKDKKAAARDPGASGSLSRPITRSGAIMGTRAYMAPEQYEGKKADYRADQFSFCVALYEALYGARPFPGDTEEELFVSVFRGQVAPPPPDRRVPNWVRRVLLKGLETKRDNRHPSMDVLLEELEKDPQIIFRRVALMSVALGVLVSVGLLLLQRDQQKAEEVAQLEIEKEAERAQKLEEQHKKEALAVELRQRGEALTLAEVSRFEMASDPTRALARLKNLTGEFEGWSTEARVLASDAKYRGIASRVLTLPDGEVAQGLSPDGRLVATRNPTTGSVRLFDTEDESSHELGIGGTMPEIAFSADGSRLAALRFPDGVRLWDLSSATNRKLGEIEDGHFEIAFDPTGAVLVYGRHPELHRWTVSGQQILDRHEERVVSVAVHPEGTLAATTDAAGRSRLWNLSTLESEELEGIGPVAFSPTGHLAIVTDEGDIRVSDPGEPQESARTFSGPGSDVDVLVFSPGSSRLAAGTIEGQLAWWELASGDRHDLPGTQDEVESLRFVEDGKLGATSLSNLVLHELDGSPPQVLRGHGGVGFWTVREDGEVVTVGHEGTIRVWSPRPSPVRSLVGHVGEVTAAVGGPDGVWVTAGDGGVIQRWGSKMERAEVVTDNDGQAVTALTISPSGTLAWATSDNDVRILPPNIEEPKVLQTYDDLVVVLQFGPEGSLAIAPPGGGVQLWDPAAAKMGASWTLEGLTVHSVGFDDHGVAEAIGWTQDDQYFVVDLASDGTEKRHELPSAGVLAAAYAPDGSFIAFTSADRSVSVYDGATRRVRRLGQHAGLVNAVTIAPDGKTIVSGGDDGEVRIWDVQSGYGRPVPLSDRPLYAVAMSENGDQFVALGESSSGAIAFVGFDDLPRTARELRAWVDRATDLDVEIKPIDWVAQRYGSP
jgi:serine/threonine protein kinase/WD40 repeat protein